MSLRILVAGGEGQLGREFAALAVDGIAADNMEIVCCARRELDITDPASIAVAFAQHQPQAVINAAAYTAVDRAETESEQAYLINADGAGHLARAAAQHQIPLLHVSTDYVFSGDRPIGEQWQESDACAPQSVYGASKLAGEQQVLASGANALILRTSWVFGRYGNNFPKTMLRLARERDELRVVGDQYGCPTHAGDIAKTLLMAARAMIDNTLAGGVYHYSGAQACTWHDFATHIIERAHALGKLEKKPRIIAIATHEYPVAAKRPMNSVLDNSKLQQALGIKSTPWQQGLDVLLQSV